MRHVLARAGLRVPDLDASIEHLVATLGLEERSRDGEAAQLALPGQPPCVELIAAGSAAIDSMTLTTAAANLAEIAQRAEARGVAVDEVPGGSIRLMVPNGVRVDVGAGEPPARNVTPREAGPVVGALDHVSLTARDLHGCVSFFVEVLGFRLSDRVGERRYWLRCNENHHTVALFEGDDGLQHYAFAAGDVGELKRLGDLLAARGQNFLWGLGRHGLGENVFSYHLDPAGAILELCSDMVQIPDDDAWEVGVWSEHTTASAIMWGQLPPPEFRQTWIPSARGLAHA